jgi:hypothetical protein
MKPQFVTRSRPNQPVYCNCSFNDPGTQFVFGIKMSLHLSDS